MWAGHWVTDHSALEFDWNGGQIYVQHRDYETGTVAALPSPVNSTSPVCGLVKS